LTGAAPVLGRYSSRRATRQAARIRADTACAWGKCRRQRGRWPGSRLALGPVPPVASRSLLADGQLVLGGLPTFLAAGDPAPPDVRIVTLTATHALVSLPADVAAGVATAQVFIVLPEEPVLSNPLALVLR
jgi:hypothetical protein